MLPITKQVFEKIDAMKKWIETDEYKESQLSEFFLKLSRNDFRPEKIIKLKRYDKLFNDGCIVKYKLNSIGGREYGVCPWENHRSGKDVRRCVEMFVNEGNEFVEYYMNENGYCKDTDNDRLPGCMTIKKGEIRKLVKELRK